MYIFIDSSWNVERRVSSVRNNACTGAPARRSSSIYMYIHIFDIQLCIYWLILKCNTTHQNRFLCMTRWCMHKCKKKQQCKYIEVCHKHMLYMYIHWCIHIYVHWLVLKCETAYFLCMIWHVRRFKEKQRQSMGVSAWAMLLWLSMILLSRAWRRMLYASLRTHKHTHTHTQTHTEFHTHSHTLSLSHTRARARIHTHTHTLTCLCGDCW